jgi:Protein of unknown function (DUF3500)
MMRAVLVLALFAGAGTVWLSAQRRRPASAMADSAKAFLATLDTDQKAKATFPFNAEERLNWHFIPKERKGLPLKEMNATQKKAALDLLRAGLAEKGFTKAETIRGLEEVLREQEHDTRGVRDPEKYYFTVFGEPSDGGTWGWRYEGHHCSQNWTLVNGRAIASSPQFFGANPAEVREGPKKGTRVLAAEEDLARTLVKALNTSQRAEAVLAEKAPGDIITGAQRQAAIQEDKGIAYGKLTREQQGMLLALIEEYTNAQPRDLARARLEKIRAAGLDGVKFAWMGGLDRGQGHYYRIQGSTFLVEYDNTQNNANHIHAVWRDFKGDFGTDLLAAHYQESPHHASAK